MSRPSQYPGALPSADGALRMLMQSANRRALAQRFPAWLPSQSSDSRDAPPDGDGDR